MNNSIFNLLNGGKNARPQNQMSAMLQAFNQFKQGFQGDARQEVMRLVQSGKISQQELNELQSIANQLQQFLK